MLQCFRTHPEQPFPGLAAMRARSLRDTVWRMETFDALRERVLDRFEALGAIELKGVADPVPLFRAASW
jgi:class 3 adenylate cyclase